MFTIKIYNFLKFIDIYFKYKTLKTTNNFLLINCSEENLTPDYFMNDLFPIPNENTLVINNLNTETFTSNNLSNLNISESYSGDLPQNYHSNFVNDNIFQDDQGGFMSINPQSLTNLLDCQVEDLPEDLSDLLSTYKLRNIEKELDDTDNEPEFNNIETDDDINLSPSNFLQNITSCEYTQTEPVPTISTQQTITSFDSYRNIEEENLDNLNQEAHEYNVHLLETQNPIVNFINTFECSEYISATTIYGNIEILNSGESVINEEKVQDTNTMTGEYLSINRIGHDNNNFNGSISKEFYNFHSKPTNPNLNIEITDSAELLSSQPTNTNIEVEIPKSYSCSSTPRQKNTKRRKKITPSILNINMDLPSDLSTLIPDENYNLNFHVFKNSAISEKFIVKTFTFTLESVIILDSCREIKYSISNIPKILVPRCNEWEKNKFFDLKNISERFTFYHKYTRTIQLQKHEKLKLEQVAFVLEPFCEPKFWRKNLVNIIRGREYRITKPDRKKISKLGKTNIKKKRERTLVAGFILRMSRLDKSGNPIRAVFRTIRRKLIVFNNRLTTMSKHEFSLKNIRQGCIYLLNVRNEFIGGGKIVPLLTELNELEEEIKTVYNLVYNNFEELSYSIIYCYNEFIRDEDVLDC